MTTVIKKLKLDLKDIPDNRKREAKEDVLEFIENETMRFLARGKSPVEGERFDKLTTKYAKKEKQGNTIANLQLEGDLVESYEKNILSGDDISFGYSASNSQVEKADGHNQFSAKAKAPKWKGGREKLPKRRFIPTENQKLHPSIRSGINNILSEFRKPVEQQRREETFASRTRTDSQRTSVVIDSGILSDETVIDVLTREFEKGLL